ncbi:MAG: 4Fe-4S ferredoxin, partial [bacterium]
MLEKDGVPEDFDIEKILPPHNRRKSHPYVVVECFQEIPCDPCYESCPFSAFEPFKHIKDLP